jgi:hypothetical protein
VAWIQLKGGKDQQQTSPQTPVQTNNPIMPVSMNQANNLPNLNVIQYVAKNTFLEESLQKKYAGFSIEQISFSNLSEKEKKYILDELDICQDTQENFSFKVPMFREDLDEQRKEISQYSIAVLVAASKAEGGDLMHRALSSYNVSENTFRTGELLAQEKKPVERKGLAAVFLGRWKR